MLSCDLSRAMPVSVNHATPILPSGKVLGGNSGIRNHAANKGAEFWVINLHV